MAKVTWRTVNVYADGSIDYVSKMAADTGDGIIWFVANQTPLTVKVKVKDFHKKSGGANLAVVDFFADSSTVTPGTTPGIIAGQVNYLPSSGTVTMKYTISVKVDSGGWVDHDPDLDVNRPGR